MTYLLAISHEYQIIKLLNERSQDDFISTSLDVAQSLSEVWHHQDFINVFMTAYDLHLYYHYIISPHMSVIKEYQLLRRQLVTAYFQ